MSSDWWLDVQGLVEAPIVTIHEVTPGPHLGAPHVAGGVDIETKPDRGVLVAREEGDHRKRPTSDHAGLEQVGREWRRTEFPQLLARVDGTGRRGIPSQPRPGARP